MSSIASFFQSKKDNKEKIACLTAYDFPFAKILDDAGIDLILVGDSLGNVVLGYENTHPVEIDEMVHHTKAVKRGVSKAYLASDMPKKSFSFIDNEIIKDASLLIEAGAQAVKIEGDIHLKIIRELVKFGIPVMGHIGYTPQLINKPAVQGKDESSANLLLESAKKLEDAGVFSIVLELVEKEVSKKITQVLKIPTIGIGSGPFCDGQILVLHDMIGLTSGKTPNFVKKYADVGSRVREAAKQYVDDVRSSCTY